MYEGTETVVVKDISNNLFMYLDNYFDRLEATVREDGWGDQPDTGRHVPRIQEGKQIFSTFILKPEQEVVDTGRWAQPAVMNVSEVIEEMFRETWDKWIKGWKVRTKFRVVFLFEHDLTEVESGLDGQGYPIEQHSVWVQRCILLLKVTLRNHGRVSRKGGDASGLVCTSI